MDEMSDEQKLNIWKAIARLDAQPVPKKDRLYYNPETGEIEPVPEEMWKK